VPNEDVSALVAAMARLMSDAESETRLAAVRQKCGTFQFRKGNGMWEALLGSNKGKIEMMDQEDKQQ